jgi:hypothetical protein
MKTLVLTGCDRNMDCIGRLTAKNHQAYALRHGYDFERFTDYDGLPYAPSWHKLHLLRDRLKEYDRILWIDADAVITNPLIPVEILNDGLPGLTVSHDWSGKKGDIPPNRHFSMGNFVITKCDRSEQLVNRALELEAKFGNDPASLWEQACMQWLYDHDNHQWRSVFNIMPRRRLNSVPGDLPGLFDKPAEPWEAGDFLAHFTWIPMQKRAELFPQYDYESIKAATPFIPEWHELHYTMDRRHIAVIHHILMSGYYRTALEIGTWMGCSTSAFLAPIKEGKIKKAYFNDTLFRHECRQITDQIPDNKKEMIQKYTNEYLAGETQEGKFDVVIEDGCHDLDPVKKEIAHIERLKPRIIIGHDCSEDHGCPGPKYAKEYLESKGWTVLGDANDRQPFEHTHRGLFAAARKKQDLDLIIEALALACYY